MLPGSHRGLRGIPDDAVKQPHPDELAVRVDPGDTVVVLGLERRDAEIEALGQTIRNLGAAGLDTAVYTWTAVFSWLRTDLAVPVRGGGPATGYDHAVMQKRPPATVAVSCTRCAATR